MGNPPPTEGGSSPLDAFGAERPRATAVKEYNRARTARSLVEYFRLQCAKNFWGQTPGVLNEAALRSQFSRWIKVEGVPYEMVKAMIDVFVSDKNYIRKDTPAWKSFLNQRQKLFLIAERRAQSRATTTNWERKIRDARDGVS